MIGHQQLPQNAVNLTFDFHCLFLPCLEKREVAVCLLYFGEAKIAMCGWNNRRPWRKQRITFERVERRKTESLPSRQQFGEQTEIRASKRIRQPTRSSAVCGLNWGHFFCLSRAAFHLSTLWPIKLIPSPGQQRATLCRIFTFRCLYLPLFLTAHNIPSTHSSFWVIRRWGRLRMCLF